MLNEPWFELLQEILQQPWFLELKEKIRVEYTSGRCYPRADQIFRAFQLTHPKTIRVVILTQEPYAFGEADGCCLSTQDSRTPYSLQRVLREVDRDVVKSKSKQEFKELFPTNDLTSWARQGVFLLNSVLTVKAGEVGSHVNLGWQQFTKNVLQILVSDNEHKVFCLFGKAAEDLCKDLQFQSNHKILKAGHPASGNHGKDRFSGCNFASKTNYYLWRNNLPEINWTTNGK